MPLEVFPRITRDDVKQAEQDRLLSFLAAAGGVAGLTAGNYFLNAPGGKLVQKPLQLLFTGVEVKPTPSGRAAVRIPPPSIVAFTLPTPVGFVPGEFYGLHPGVVKRTLGIPAGKKPVIFDPSAERVRVFEATITAERIAARALQTEVILGRASGHPFRDIPPGPIAVTPEELAFLESLPAGLTPAQRLIPQLQARRSELNQVLVTDRSFLNDLHSIIDATPATPSASSSPFASVVPSASIQPELIQPVNAAALANMEAAEGIRAALVHERADP